MQGQSSCSSLLCFKYHSRTLFVNPGVIIWNETAIFCYSDLALTTYAGKGLRKRDRQAGTENEKDRGNTRSLNSNERNMTRAPKALKPTQA